MAAATSAAVHDLPALVSAVHEGHWHHDRGTVIGAVSRAHVHMHGIQADRTVVAIASVVQRLHGRAAIDANESAVLVVPRHLRLPGLSSKGAGFRFFFGLVDCAQTKRTRSSYCACGRSRLVRVRDPFTALPLAITSGSGFGSIRRLRSVRTSARFVRLNGPL